MHIISWYDSQMDIIICDISAFDFWRTPPIVRMLLAANEQDQNLRSILDEQSIANLRASVANSSLCKTFLQPNTALRKPGNAAKALAPITPLLAANHQGPIDIAVESHSQCHNSSIIRPRFCARPIPLDHITAIDECVSVASPQFALLQIARRASLARTIMLASELCGTFAIYQAAPPIRSALQTIANSRAFPQVGGWKPFITAQGMITDLWSRPALATPDELMTIARDLPARRGSGRLRLAASLTTPGAASPLEVQAGMLLGLSRQYGGEGYTEFSFNKRVDLSPDARALAQRSHCYCDLYWDDGVDVECQSAAAHNQESSFLSDSDRTAALTYMGIDVIPVTYGQLADEHRFNALSRTIAKVRGKRIRPKTNRQVMAVKELRRDLFRPWSTLHHV